MKDDIQEISTSEFSLGEKKIGTDWIAFSAMNFSGR